MITFFSTMEFMLRSAPPIKPRIQRKTAADRH